MFASRAVYAGQIDACIADDAKCRALCDWVLLRDGGSTSTGSSKELVDCQVVEVRPDGMVLDIEWMPYQDEACGRRPRGFTPPARGQACGAGVWLARIATLEAASVTAFAHLVRSLQKLGAPRALIAAARRAIADELVHAHLVARLAARRGAAIETPAICETPEPTLAELALHNAIEGEVGETFGALLATCQARLAADADVRTAFRQIAPDETRHAALSRALGVWLEGQLSRGERDDIRTARHDAIAAIHGDFGLTARERVSLGVPDPEPLCAAAAATFAELTESRAAA